MTAEDLFSLTDVALKTVGYPSWTSADDPDACDELLFLEAEHDVPAQWALVPVGEDDPDDDDCLALGVEMAAALIREHLRTVLLDRGWQVQVSMRKDRRRWRLVDCLSPADGGGDRLGDAVEYPWGEDELAVLCDSVRAVHGGA